MTAPAFVSVLVVMLGIGWAQLAAAVEITEVAWMGSAASPNHEWIELHNPSGGAVDVEGWTIADGNNFLVTLVGSIPPESYAVLERSSDDSAPGTAFFIYTGPLVNTGATLTLRRADGQIEDQVVGGENWQSSGGNNETKETAQRTASGWRTGVATPGNPPGATSVPSQNSSDDNSNGGSTAGGGARATVVRPVGRTAATPLTPSTAELRLTVEAQTVAYENQTVTFTARAEGLSDTIRNSLVYEWNFGDFATGSGRVARHHYRHDGKYIVTVRARFARHDVTARHELVVMPVTLVLEERPDGTLLMRNTASYDLDISEYRVEARGSSLTIPPRSYIMAGETLLVPLEASVGRSTASPVLIDARGERVGSSNVSEVPLASLTPVPTPQPLVVSEETQSIPEPPVIVPSPEEPATAPLVEYLPLVEAAAISDTSSIPPQRQSTTTGASAESKVTTAPTIRWPYLLLALLIFSGFIFIGRRTST